MTRQSIQVVDRDGKTRSFSRPLSEEAAIGLVSELSGNAVQACGEMVGALIQQHGHTEIAKLVLALDCIHRGEVALQIAGMYLSGLSCDGGTPAEKAILTIWEGTQVAEHKTYALRALRRYYALSNIYYPLSTEDRESISAEYLSTFGRE